MKLKFVSDFDYKRKKGYEVEVDKILFDEVYSGGFKVRVRDWKRPKWISLLWFIEVPDDYYTKKY